MCIVLSLECFTFKCIGIAVTVGQLCTLKLKFILLIFASPWFLPLPHKHANDNRLKKTTVFIFITYLFSDPGDVLTGSPRFSMQCSQILDDGGAGRMLYIAS